MSFCLSSRPHGLLFPIMSLVNTGATIPNTSQSSKRRCIHITLNLACLWVHQELLQSTEVTWVFTIWMMSRRPRYPFLLLYRHQQTRESAKRTEAETADRQTRGSQSPTISLVWFNGFWRNGSYCSKWLLTILVTQASYTVAPFNCSG